MAERKNENNNSTEMAVLAQMKRVNEVENAVVKAVHAILTDGYDEGDEVQKYIYTTNREVSYELNKVINNFLGKYECVRDGLSDFIYNKWGIEVSEDNDDFSFDEDEESIELRTLWNDLNRDVSDIDWEEVYDTLSEHIYNEIYTDDEQSELEEIADWALALVDIWEHPVDFDDEIAEDICKLLSKKGA